MRTNEDYIRFGIGQLLVCGIDVYFKIGNFKWHVAKIDDELCQIYIQKAYIREHVSILSLTKAQESEFYTDTHKTNYMLAVDVEAQMCWLLPIDIMWGKKTICLGPKYDKYKLTYRRIEATKRVKLAKQITQNEVRSSLTEKLHEKLSANDDIDLASILDKKET